MYSSRPWTTVALAATLLATAFPGTGRADEARTILANSVRPVASARTSAVTAGDLNASMSFSIGLKMRNTAELQERINRGEIVSQAEMAAKYYPLRSDADTVAAWLTAQGFAVKPAEDVMLSVFATGTVQQLQQTFQVSFAKVQADDGVYTSAVTAPSVPTALAPAMLSVNGLQPDRHPRKHSIFAKADKNPLISNAPPFLTAEIFKAYGGSGLAVTGSGQTIAIVIDTFPSTTDLTKFWTACGVNQTLANIAFVQVVPGILSPPSGEETLDTEWTSGMAPGAKVRVYASLDLFDSHLDQVFQKLINDIPSQPNMHQVSISLGSGETEEEQQAPGQIQTDSAFFMSMAAAGLSVLASSGDTGNEINGVTQVSYYASDPNVAGVGGTSLTLDGAGNASTETAWTGGGGGISTVFDRPTWQTGTGVLTGTTRLVPDVSATADPNTGALVVLGGSNQQIGGTSWSAPTWAAYCALINQARATSGLAPLGLLGPKVYPLIGTPSFRDITTGSNGYSAGPGYDLCAGVGVPVLKTLIQTLSFNGPNLTLTKPTGWSSNIVVSNVTGTNTDSTPLSYTDSLFVDYTLINNGGLAATQAFATQLLVDGSVVNTFTNTPPLNSKATLQQLDIPIGVLAAGNHTIEVNIDSLNVITENDETDNVIIKNIFVISAPPVVTASPGSLTYTENDPPTPIDTGITVTDSDTPEMAGATIAITKNFAPGEDVLSLAPTNGFTSSYDPNRGILTLLGSLPPAAYQAALQNVRYYNLSDNPSTKVRTVTFAVNDGGSAGTATRTINVISVNDAPVANSVNVLTNEDTPKAFALTGTDAENSALTFTITSQPQHGQITGTVPNVTYTPSLNYNGPDSFTFKVNDGQLNSVVDATVSITVFPVNDAPVADPQNLTSVEDAALPITLTGSDVDSSTITFSVATQPQHGTLTGIAPALVYQPGLNYVGSDSFTVTANDGELDSAPATISITVLQINHAPIFTVGPNQLVIDTAPHIVPGWATGISQGGGGDVGQTVSFIVQSDHPEFFSAQPAVAADGTLTYQATSSAFGVTIVTVTAHDNGGTALGGIDTSAPQTFQILVSPPNFAPTFTAGPDVIVPQGSSAYAQPWATNIDPGAPHESTQVLNFILQVDHPELFSAAPAISPTGVLSFTPASGASGLANVTVTLHDDGGTANSGHDTSAPQDFTIAVSTFVEEVGTYNGLIVPAAGAPTEEARFGSARVTVAATGAVTAKVELGGISYSVKGNVDLVGNIHFGKLAADTTPLKRPRGQSTLDLGFVLDVSKGTDKLAGTITDQGVAYAVLDADRALYTSKSNPTPPYMNVPAGLAGKYTALFAAQTPVVQGLAPDLYPQGDGIAFISVSTAGVVTVTGTLADGSKVSTSNALSKVNALPFHVLTDGRKGSVTGPVMFRDMPGVSDLDATDIAWIKPVNIHTRSYPGGWARGIGIDVVGSAYAPTAGQPALPGLGAPGANGNAHIALSIGGLAIGGIPSGVNIDSANHVAIITPTDDKLVLKINAKTGGVTGGFIFPVSNRHTNIFGVILQKSQRSSGYFISDLASGHFSLVPLP